MTDRKRNRLIRQHRILQMQVETNLEEYISKLSTLIVKYINQYPTDWEKGKKEILDILYDSFAETISITTSNINNIYSKSKKGINLANVLNSTYSADGKTLEERVERWWNEAEEKIKTNSSNSTAIIVFLINKLLNILKNENNIISNHTIKEYVAPYATILVIDGTPECGPCNDYVGEYSADENITLPPYHANCGCFAYYDITDDPDDFNDLDLETEENLLT